MSKRRDDPGLQASERRYIACLKAAVSHTEDGEARRLLVRTAERLADQATLDIRELLLLSVAAMASRPAAERESWGESVARRHPELGSAVRALLDSCSAPLVDGRRPVAGVG